MKFILNENKKFKLEERFILVEAEEDPNSDTFELDSSTDKSSEVIGENTDGSIDWEAIYKACKQSKNAVKATEKFWYGGLPTPTQIVTDEEQTIIDKEQLPIVSEKASKGYFKGEWESKASWITDIRVPLIEEIEVFGWDRTKNPFIAYLHQIDNITPAAYNGLHNAYISKYISKIELQGKDPLLGNNNLIFIKAFRNITSTTDSENYLELQATLKRNDMYKKFGQSLEAVLSNIFDINGKLDKENINHKININKLRSVEEIEEILNTQSTQPATQEDVDDLVKQYENKVSEIPGLLYFLIVSNLEIYKKLNLSKDVINILNNKVSNNTIKLPELVNFNSKLNNTFTPEQLTKIITDLSKKL